MPLKILVWNIQTFTVNKVTPSGMDWFSIPSPANMLRFGSFNALKRGYILSNVNITNPDIFAVIEVISGWGNKGSLVTNRGAQGCQQLLTYLRSACNDNWRLVPPLKLTDKVQIEEIDGEGDNDEGLMQLLKEGGYTEAIGVFYRQDRVDFIGPYVWPNTPDNAGKKAVPPGLGITPGPYPDTWQNCLPASNYYAGQYEFKAPDGKEVFFPAHGSRRPFFTKFREKQGKNRVIDLVTVHFPPNTLSAIEGYSKLLGMLGKKQNPIAANEVVVIAGDYNINPFSFHIFDSPMVKDDGYHVLIQKGFFQNSSMNYRISTAEPKRYLKQDTILDNVTVRYGSDGAVDGNPAASLIDRVVTNSLLDTPMNTILQLPTQDQQNTVFRHQLNFGKLGPNPGTSDHLALLIQV